MKEIRTGVGWTELTEKSSPNWLSTDGKPYLKYCPSCTKENYAMNVSLGICTWCGYKLEVPIAQQK